MKDPFISIITVSYNSRDTIARTIKSVFSQSYNNIEYIIIDGCSKDGTIDIIKESIISRQNVIFISEVDNGIYHAMNKGIKLAKGSLIGILNSDDWYQDNAVEKIIDSYKLNGEGIYYGFLRLIKDNKEFLVERSNYQFLPQKMIQHPTCFVSKSLYEKHGLFNEGFRSAADYDFMMRLNVARVKFVMIDHIITNFTLGGASSSVHGALESLKIKRNYNCISKTKYFYKYAILVITAFIKKVSYYDK